MLYYAMMAGTVMIICWTVWLLLKIIALRALKGIV